MYKHIRHARTLRKNPTEVEKKLWSKLRSRQLQGLKFRRQQTIGPYVVDFINLEEKVIIELDGGQHNEEKNINKDLVRTAFLEKEGFKVLRFWNNEVNNNLDGVLSTIVKAIETPHQEEKE